MQASRRGLRIAVAGLLLQVLLVAMAVALRGVTGTTPALPAVWLILAAVPVWLLTVLLFHCRYLERREAQELEELTARGGERAGIFAAEAEARPAANRLRWIHKYLVPAFTLAEAGYHIGLGIWMLRWVRTAEASPAQAPIAIFFALGGAFLAFLLSRYATGMAKSPSWRLLRAPGSYLFLSALVLALLGVVLLLENYGVRTVGVVVAYLFSAFLVIVGVELVLNFVLDLYRPRVPGAEQRPAYDSRLLNLIASPERIGRSIADALNYQFGFQVSSTWFYQLLQKALVPLLLVGAVVLWLMTSVVVVDEGEKYVVLRWGKRQPERVLGPSRWPYLICPWPIDTARKFDTEQVQEMWLGVGGKREETLIKGKRMYLWTEPHGPYEELNTLLARPPRGPEGPGVKKVPSAHVIKLTVAVYYQIDDPYRFGYAFTDARELLKCIAHREMVHYAASATVDAPLPDRKGRRVPQAIMSFGRGYAEEDLLTNIRAAAERDDLGVKILRVQVLGCHPPKEATPAFEEVIAAEREQDKLRYEAQAQANKMLATVAGDPGRARTLAQLISALRDLDDLLKALQAGTGVQKVLGNTIRETQNAIKSLQEEIELDRLMGRIRAAAPDEAETTAQYLLQRRLEHLGRLERIEADPKGFPLEQELADLRAVVRKRFTQEVQGSAAVAIARARAVRWRKEFRERSRAGNFPAQLAALRAAPSVYPTYLYLDAWAEATKDGRKYVVAMDSDLIEWWLNIERPPPAFEVPYGKEQE